MALKKMPLTAKLLALVLALGLAALAALTIALKVFLPPEKIRELVAQNARKALKREVRLEGISLGALHGLRLEGVEVSELPDFSAGTFASLKSFQLKVRLMPLLRRQIIVDTIALDGLSVEVRQGKDGRFNFSDLLEAPPKTGAPPASKAPEPLPVQLDVRRASLSDGTVSYRDPSGQWRLSKIEAQAGAISLDKPFDAKAALRFSGSVQGGLSWAGQVDLSGLQKGRLSVLIRELEAEANGLALELAGSVKLDKERVEMPNLKGRLAGAALAASLTVADYAKAPSVVLDAKIGKLDAGKLMAAMPRKPAAQGKAEGPSSGEAPKAPVSTAPSPPIRAKGSLAVEQLVYSGVTADETKVSWDLKGITPDLKDLGGWAKLHVAGGSFASGAKPGERSPLLKALLVPVTILREIGKLGSALKILPDFSHFQEVVGDYAFQNGVMTIRDFRLRSAAANVVTKGSVDLAAQRLDLLVTLFIAKLAPIDIGVGGTFDDPKPRFKAVKTLTEPAKIITKPALDLFKGIFKK